MIKQPQQVPHTQSSSSAGVITRRRSSSKTKSNYNPISSHEQQQLSLRSNELSPHFQQQLESLDQLVWVLKLKSLNGTFESKTLIVPNGPETLKFGRPGGSKIQSKTTNGFFDSRVLSRNHAELFIDKNKSALFIRDLKSSNGTYINGKQIEPFKIFELKINDKFDLGSNLENQTAHKKISCEITDLLLMSLKDYNESVYKLDQERQINEKEFFNNAIDALIYGDVVNDMYEDNILSILAVEKNDNTKQLENNFSISGLYPSSNIKNVSKLEDTISHLLVIINNEFLQNEKLKKIYKFLVSYNENLDKLEEFMMDRDTKVNAGLQDNINEYISKIEDSNSKIEGLNNQVIKLRNELQQKDDNNLKTRQLLQDMKKKLKQKDDQLNQYKGQMDELNKKYDDLVKEKEIVINFQNEEIKEFKQEGENDFAMNGSKTNSGHENGVARGSITENGNNNNSMNNEKSDEKEDIKEMTEGIKNTTLTEKDKNGSEMSSVTKSQQSLNSLYTTGFVLAASVIIGGVATVYQRQ